MRVLFDYFRVACAVPYVSLGDVKLNTDSIIRYIGDNSDADLIVFPELSMTGYTCSDLFFQNSLIDGVKHNLSRILDKSKAVKSIVAVGAPILISGQLYDCAVVINKGKINGITVKSFLPNYNEFYEKRWFSVSADLNTDFISSKELGLDENYDIPVGSNLIYKSADGLKFGVEICEDLWTAVPPSTFMALNGAEVILNLSASNETISKRRYRQEFVKQ